MLSISLHWFWLTSQLGEFGIFENVLGIFIPKSTQPYCLLPVHTLVEVLKLQLALLLGARLSDAMGTLDPFLLKNVAAGGLLVGLRPTLCQYPVVQVHAQPLVQVHKGHDAAKGLEKTMDRIRCVEPRHKSVNEPADCCWKNLNIFKDIFFWEWARKTKKLVFCGVNDLYYW